MPRPVSSAFLFCCRVGVGCAALAFGAALAGEFRDFQVIAAPSEIPADSAPVEQIQPVARGAIEDATEQLLSAWNGGGLDKHLAEDFFDRDRLQDNIADKVPRDARLRLVSIQGSQTLEQFERDGGQERISLVSVTASTQLEFNDPTRGFRVLPGTNEFLLRITESESGADSGGLPGAQQSAL